MLGVEAAFGVAAAAACVAAAVSDARSFTIPNWIPSSLVALLFAAWAAGAPAPAPASAGIAAVSVFSVSVVLWLRGGCGGGDVKLLTAAAAWAGTEGLPQMLFVTSLVGGALAAAMLASRRLGGADPAPWLSRLGAGAPGIPYGVAIACGAAPIILDASSTFP